MEARSGPEACAGRRGAAHPRPQDEREELREAGRGTAAALIKLARTGPRQGTDAAMRAGLRALDASSKGRVVPVGTAGSMPSRAVPTVANELAAGVGNPQGFRCRRR